MVAFVGMDITPSESLTRFADIRTARTVENTLYFGIVLLWVVHSLALYRVLRRTGPTPALFGTTLSILGLVLLAAGAVPHLATEPLFDLYDAPAATPHDQTTLVLVWQGVEAMYDALLYTGLAIIHVGLLMLGTAMLRTPQYGQRAGRATIAVGVAGLAAAAAVFVGVPDVAAVGVLLLAGLHLCLGRNTLRLGGVSHQSQLGSG